MLEGLRALYEREGLLSLRLINADPAIPTYSNYQRRLGNIRELYALLGLPPHPRNMGQRMRAAKGQFVSSEDAAKAKRNARLRIARLRRETGHSIPPG
jgi:hypothetical protein